MSDHFGKLACPSCGAPLDAPANASTITCLYCGSVSALRHPDDQAWREIGAQTREGMWRLRQGQELTQLQLQLNGLRTEAATLNAVRTDRRMRRRLRELDQQERVLLPRIWQLQSSLGLPLTLGPERRATRLAGVASGLRTGLILMLIVVCVAAVLATGTVSGIDTLTYHLLTAGPPPALQAERFARRAAAPKPVSTIDVAATPAVRPATSRPAAKGSAAKTATASTTPTSQAPDPRAGPGPQTTKRDSSGSRADPAHGAPSAGNAVANGPAVPTPAARPTRVPGSAGMPPAPPSQAQGPGDNGSPRYQPPPAGAPGE